MSHAQVVLLRASTAAAGSYPNDGRRVTLAQISFLH